MKVRFERRFYRDLRRVRDQGALKKVEALIEETKVASSVHEIHGLVKLQGYQNYYRVRLGDWRVGVVVDGDAVIFVRFLHRKDIYRYFP